MGFKYIKKFIISYADYVLGDEDGNILFMKVDYEKRSFQIKIGKKNGEQSQLIKKEAEQIAKDLLKRKSGINFSKKP